MLLTEFDEARDAVINPDIIHTRIPDFPETVVSVFSHHLFSSVLNFLGGRVIAETHDVDGVWPMYEVSYKGKRFAFYKARLGAPACVGSFEDVIPMGAKRIILLGNCGVLDKRIRDCGIIIPTKAIRDEGTSYHYAPAADCIDVNKKYVEEFLCVLEEFGYPHVRGVTWTTDAFYRETRDKIERRKQMGAVCVEMECAAMQAMCNFRGVEFFQFLYAGDNLDHSAWDPRSLSGSARLEDKEKIALLAFELAWRIRAREDFLETDRLILRKFRESDFGDFCEFAIDPEMCRMMGRADIHDEASARPTFDWLINHEERGYALVLKETGRVIGNLTVCPVPAELTGLPELRGKSGRSLSFSISRHYRRQGPSISATACRPANSATRLLCSTTGR